MTLEGEKPKVEGVELTPKEGEKPTPPEEKPTVGITETPEFRKELDKALGKGLESTNRQLSLSQAKTKAAEADAERFKTESASRQAHIQSLTKEVEAALVDDPEKRQAYVSRIAGLEREQKVAEREAAAERKFYDAEKLAYAAGMERKATAVHKETGIPMEELESCQTEAEIEVKGLRFQLTKEPEVKEPEKEPKFDSGMSSGKGGGRKPSLVELKEASAQEYAEKVKSGEWVM